MNIQKAIAHSRKIAKELEKSNLEIYDYIFEEIDKTPAISNAIPDNNHIEMCTVNFSTLKENKFNLSPSYYLQNIQNEAIKSSIRKSEGNLEKVQKILVKILADKYVIYKGEKIRLNESSIQTLATISVDLC